MPVHYLCYNFAPISILFISVTSNVPVVKGPVNERVLLNLESWGCVLSLVTVSPYQPKRTRGFACLCLCFMQVLYGGAVEGSALSVWLAVWVSSVCVCACVPLGYKLIEHANRKAAAASLGLGERALGTLGWGPAAGRRKPWAPICWSWRPLITSLSIPYLRTLEAACNSLFHKPLLVFYTILFYCHHLYIHFSTFLNNISLLMLAFQAWLVL